MNRQTLRRLVVKGTMTYIAVFSLVLMVAMPALALVANSVGTREIKNHSIRSADIRNKAVTTDRIAPRAVKRGKIGKKAIRTEHVNYIADSKIRYSKKTSYLSIPVAAFAPNSKGLDYVRSTSIRLMTGTGSFYAPVELPQNAVVTKFTYHHKDDTLSGHTYAKLTRVKHGQVTVDDMANPGASANFGGWKSKSDESIAYNPILNNTHAYYVYVYMNYASDSLRAGTIVIEYTYTSPGS